MLCWAGRTLTPAPPWPWPGPGPPQPAGLGEDPVAAQDHDHGPGEEVGGDQVEGGGETQEEGEPPDRSHGEEVEAAGADERDQVGGQDGAVGPGEAAVDRGAHRLARSDLVLEPLQVRDGG